MGDVVFRDVLELHNKLFGDDHSEGLHDVDLARRVSQLVFYGRRVSELLHFFGFTDNVC